MVLEAPAQARQGLLRGAALAIAAEEGQGVATLLPVGLGLAGGQTIGYAWVGEQGADGVLGIGVDPVGVALKRGSGWTQLARCLLRVPQDLPVAAEVLVLAAQGLAALLPLVDAAGGPLELGGAVVAGEVLAAVAREGAVEAVAIGEGLAVGVEMDALAVTGHRDVGRVTLHQRIRKGVGAVHGGALALVDGDRVAVAIGRGPEHRGFSNAPRRRVLKQPR
jgi:hypothetical protein